MIESKKAKVIIIMGVSGCGKTTVGSALAQSIGWQFKDADDYHPRANKDKMNAGLALTDQDRLPWLKLLRDEIEGWIQSESPTVLACSSLKQSYRNILAENLNQVIFAYLKGDKKSLQLRLKTRVHEYMNPNLLESQFNTLEEPKEAIVLDASDSVENLIESIKSNLVK